ncbi:hypothetical protein Cob_v008968 [Colletotrichum orbiculare MAFF 240422]|uniref:Uncharacterized protein n=1 Tax=Colletotrichum orbiculare (strain 104-T / ATCC 96160 / CBS 514.97 / LARS 414 / MAFF 240422) TaxID=1213857 RepID=A0A484FKE1_COLOR|nr:hypothetical protein Cob_v008968 [Colletotrichum orbiculare MAFF 240422]
MLKSWPKYTIPSSAEGVLPRFVTGTGLFFRNLRLQSFADAPWLTILLMISSGLRRRSSKRIEAVGIEDTLAVIIDLVNLSLIGKEPLLLLLLFFFDKQLPSGLPKPLSNTHIPLASSARKAARASSLQETLPSASKPVLNAISDHTLYRFRSVAHRLWKMRWADYSQEGSKKECARCAQRCATLANNQTYPPLLPKFKRYPRPKKHVTFQITEIPAAQLIPPT